MRKFFLLAVLLISLSGFAQKSFVTVPSTATSGTINLPETQQDIVLFHDAGLTLSLTIALPSNPTDGQTIILASSGGITTLNMTAAVGTIISGLTGMPSGGNGTWMYSQARNKWFRIR